MKSQRRSQLLVGGLILAAASLLSGVAGHATRSPRVLSSTAWLRPVSPQMVSLPTPGTGPGRGAGAGVLEKEPMQKKDPLAIGDEASRNDGMFQVLLFNDEVNTREYVARCLVVVCGLAEGDAFSIMHKAHREGWAIIGIWGSEVAEMYTKMLQSKGLSVDMSEA